MNSQNHQENRRHGGGKLVRRHRSCNDECIRSKTVLYSGIMSTFIFLNITSARLFFTSMRLVHFLLQTPSTPSTSFSTVLHTIPLIELPRLGLFFRTVCCCGVPKKKARGKRRAESHTLVESNWKASLSDATEITR